MKPLLSFAADLAQRYVESLAQRRVAPTAEAIQRLARFDLPLQEHCIDAHEVIEELDAGVTPATMAMPGPRFFGFVIGGSLPAALAADWLVSPLDQNQGLYNPNPRTSTMQQGARRWLHDPLQAPAEGAGR